MTATHQSCSTTNELGCFKVLYIDKRIIYCPFGHVLNRNLSGPLELREKHPGSAEQQKSEAEKWS